MTISHRFAALVVTACLMVFPVMVQAEAVIGTKLLSAEPYVAAMRQVRAVKPQAVAFDWLANGSVAFSASKSKTAQKRNRVITGEGSWICSPAGFGKRSRCYAG